MTDTPRPADATLLRYVADRTDDSKLTIYHGDDEVAPRLRALADVLASFTRDDIDWIEAACGTILGYSDADRALGGPPTSVPRGVTAEYTDVYRGQRLAEKIAALLRAK